METLFAVCCVCGSHATGMYDEGDQCRDIEWLCDNAPGKCLRAKAVAVSSWGEWPQWVAAAPDGFQQPTRIPKRRKVTQISVTHTFLWALCNDGTIHKRTPDLGGWSQVDPIPQPEEE